MQLPLKLPWNLASNRWASILNPIIADPTISGNVISNVNLSAGATNVFHKLGRLPQGWEIVDINGTATIYRSQPFNDKTLTLTSSAPVTVSVRVF